MEDPRTRAALDNLADLFLTGTAPGAKPPPPRNQTPAATDADAPSTAAASLEGPRPIRLAPKIRPAPANDPADQGLPMPPRTGRAGQAYLALAQGSRGAIDAAVHAAGAAASPTSASADLADAPSLSLASAQASPARQASGRPRLGRGVDPDTQPDAFVEAVFLGNLPGFGGPWLTQYARRLAQDEPGPVGVLRVSGDEISLELVGTPRPPLPQDLGDEDAQIQHTIEAWAGVAAQPDNLVELLEGLSSFEDTPVRRWLVQFVQPGEPAAVAMARDLGRWTFLCGADQAAVVGAYKLLKELVDADGGPTARRVGFMIMGSDETTSRRIVERVSAAAAGRVLRRELEFRGAQKQMMPVSLHVVGAFPRTPKLWQSMLDFFHSRGALDDALMGEEEDDLAFPSAARAGAAKPDTRRAASLDLDSLPEEMVPAEALDTAQGGSGDDAPDSAAAVLGATGSADPAPPAAAPAPMPSIPAASRMPGGESIRVRPGSFLPPRATPLPPRAAEPAPAAPAASTPAPQIVPAASAAPATPSAAPEAPAEIAAPLAQPAAGATSAAVPPLAPTPVAASAPLIPSADLALDGPDLTPYVAGGVALEARCPRHPQTRLVLDERGVLHLLRRHVSSRTTIVHRDIPVGDQAQEPLRAAIVELMEARAWVRENLALLAMTQRQFRFDASAEPVLHLFTDQAKPAAALVAHLGALIKLHLLNEIRVGATVSWFSAELN